METGDEVNKEGSLGRGMGNQIIYRKSDKWFLENEWENQITDLLKDMLDLNKLNDVVANSMTDLDQHVIYFTESADVLDDESGMIWNFRYPGMTVGHIYIDTGLTIREIKLYDDLKVFIFQKDRIKELDQFIGWHTSVMV